MAGDAKKLQPIIVKKVKKGGHAAHGGAWKIAYADFVTAMMAFFLLMWLLGSTTEGDKKGIADYFQSPLRVAMRGGDGSGDASHVIRGGGEDLTRQAGQVKRGELPQTKTYNLAAALREHRAAEQAALEGLKRKIEAMLEANPDLSTMRRQIRLDMTLDGLRIQIVDEQNRPMFASGSAVVQPYMRDLLRRLGGVLAEVPQRLTLSGHTDSTPFAGGYGGYSNWELSADRANASRRELTAGGLPTDRVLRVQGLAASMPFEPGGDATAAVNRRISIIVMNRDAEQRMFRTAPITGPDGADGSEAAEEARELLTGAAPSPPSRPSPTPSQTAPAGHSTSNAPAR
jgi:chemotaxis protein MotB